MSHDRRNEPEAERRARRIAMPELPSISGDQCVRVLVASGWLPVELTDRACTLSRDARSFVVPRLAELDPELLAHLLWAARIPPLEFVLALERVLET